MSGMTRSTPSSSDSGNIMPASMTRMSSPTRRAIMFIPNSPRPPSGMAVRDCAGLLNEDLSPQCNRESYHSGADSQVMLKTIAEMPLLWVWAEQMGDRDNNDSAERGRGKAVQEAVRRAHNAELHEDPAA